MDSLRVTDEAAAKVAVAPRVSKDFIESQIAHKGWLILGDGITDDVVNLSLGVGWGADDVHPNYRHHTLCVITTKSGFTVIGHSAPASPANFNDELGRQLAYENAFRQLWPLFAFALLDNGQTYNDMCFRKQGT